MAGAYTDNCDDCIVRSAIFDISYIYSKEIIYQGILNDSIKLHKLFNVLIFTSNMTDIKPLLKRLYEINKEIMLYAGIYNLLDWDRAVLMPKMGSLHRADQLSLMMTSIHERMTSKELNDIIQTLSKKENFDKLTELQKALVKRHEWKLSRLNKIPKEHVEEFSKLAGIATMKWEEAKDKNDFAMFLPYLEKIVAMKKKEASYIDPERHPYDVLLEDYERGMTIEKLDKVFAELKKEIMIILNKVKSSKHYNNEKTLDGLKFSEQEQKQTCMEIASMILGTDERFLIARSVHPFMTTISPDDFRITTSFRSEPFFSFSSTAHESGHALYESQYPKELAGTILFDAPSLGLHESQSRIWENQVCRSMQFWKYYYKKYQKRFDALKNISLKDFFKMINVVKPSLVRIEADELTYCMHIIIRFEIEKQMIEGTINIKELPKIWNSKYKQYLGIEPKSDALGVLQDVHWSQGSIGYFPTYALGTMYSAMIFNQMLKENPKLESEIAKGDFIYMRSWLKEHIHKYGASMATAEIIKKAIGRELEHKDLIDYFRKKYYMIYKL